MDETGRIILRAAIEEAEEALAYFAREASEVFSGILTDIDKLGATSDGKQQPLTGEEKIAAQEALDRLVAYMGRAGVAHTLLSTRIISILSGRNRFGRSLFREGWRVWRKPLATPQEREALRAALSGWIERVDVVEALLARFSETTNALEAVPAATAVARAAKDSVQTFIADLRTIQAAVYPEQ